jgi:predicted enzyme related to lactoylglutathione lyase
MVASQVLGWMDVVSTDLPTSALFYKRVFGWQLSEPWDHHGGNYRMLTRDGHYLAGAEQITPAKGAPRWTVFVVTEDMQGLIRAAVADGGAVTFAPEPLGQLGTVAMITDPLGATLGVWEPATFDPRRVGAIDGRFTGAELVTSDVAATSSFLTTTLGWEGGVPSADGRSAQFRSGTAIATIIAGEQGEWRPILGVRSVDEIVEIVELAGGTCHPARPNGIVEAADSMGATFLFQSH